MVFEGKEWQHKREIVNVFYRRKCHGDRIGDDRRLDSHGILNLKSKSLIPERTREKRIIEIGRGS
jgi:hypothetical protein